MLLMAAGLCLIFPFLVSFLMPKYIDAIPTVLLMMLYLPITIIELPYYLLIAMGKLAHQNIATYIGLGGFVLLALLSVKLGFGLNGIVGASLIGRGFRVSSTYYFIYSAYRRNEQQSSN